MSDPQQLTLESLRAFYASLGLAPSEADLQAAVTALRDLFRASSTLDDLALLDEDPSAAFRPWAAAALPTIIGSAPPQGRPVEPRDAELWQLSLREAAGRIKDGQLSPIALTEAYLERIQSLNGRLKAYITVCGDEARAAAQQAEEELRRGQYRGPLHGIPFAVKDVVYTKGIPTTGGSKLFQDFRPGFDATIVEKLRAAGAVLLGKTNLHEFAYGPTGVNLHYGTPANPWDETRLPGGSSSGSAVAVAAGLCAGAIGTDTGGSIRIPASFCGIVGLKPTYGRVSRYGVIPLAWSIDHIGPMTRTVEDAALLLNALAGYDPRDSTAADIAVPDFTQGLSDGVRGLRIGVLRSFFFQRIDPEVRAAVEEAIAVLEREGARVEEVDFPLIDRLPAIYGPIIQSEAAAFHLSLLRRHWEEYSPQVRSRLLPGLAIPATLYLQSQRAKGLALREVRALLERVDLLITPTEPVAAPPVAAQSVTIQGADEPIIAALTRLPRPFNLTGLPAISIPCGFTRGGLPIGLQLVARPWDEATVLRAGYAYEQATEWGRRETPVL